MSTSHLRSHLISTRHEQQLTVCFLEMLIETVWGVKRERCTVFLHPPPPPGHLQKVIQDFQFGLSDLHLLSVLYSFFSLILQPQSYSDLRQYCTYGHKVKCGERRRLGGHRLVSLFAPLCISSCSVWSARLAGTLGMGDCLLEPRGNADFAIYKKRHSAYTVQMGNLQTNSSWPWTRHWQSLNGLRAIQVWLQLTTWANEFPRWVSGAGQTTWRRPATTKPLLCFYTDTSKMHWLAPLTEWNVPTISISHYLCKSGITCCASTRATVLLMMQNTWCILTVRGSEPLSQRKPSVTY